MLKVTRAIEHLLLSSKSVRYSIILGVSIASVESLLLILSGYLDGSFYLPGKQLGVLEHTGAWGIIFGDMLVFSAITLVIQQIQKLSVRFPTDNSPLAKRYIRFARYCLLKSITLQRSDAKLLLFLMVFASLFWANNAYQTLHPVKYYGNDLFDSINFMSGYISTRFILGTSWIIFMPYMAFVSICTAGSIFKLVTKTTDRKMIEYRQGHPDGCGGFSFLGNINIYFVLGILIIYMELTIVLFTHDKLNPGLASGFILATILVLGASYYMLFPVFRFLNTEKRKREILNYKGARSNSWNDELIGQLLVFKNSSFSPYKPLQKAIITTARLLPIAASVTKLYLSFNAV